MSDINYKDIKVIGFDLDQTLYPKSPEIDSAIQVYIYKKISERLQISLTEAESKFRGLYQEGRGLSGSKTLLTLGFPQEEAGNIVQEALENANISSFLKPDERLIALLKNLKEKYELDIITGSNRKITLDKLSHLQIDQSLFNNLITDENGSKHDGYAFKVWMSKYPQYAPLQFLYIGDRSKTDYEVPKSLGIKSILVNVKALEPTYECPQLQNILEIDNLL